MNKLLAVLFLLSMSYIEAMQLRRSPAIPCDGNTGFHRAAQNNDLSLLQECLKKKELIGINTQNKDGDTALHVAVHNKNKKIAKMLLDNGASPSIENNKGSTPAFGMSLNFPAGTFNAYMLGHIRRQEVSRKSYELWTKQGLSLKPIEMNFQRLPPSIIPKKKTYVRPCKKPRRLDFDSRQP